jgi:hypothetical protein
MLLRSALINRTQPEVQASLAYYFPVMVGVSGGKDCRTLQGRVDGDVNIRSIFPIHTDKSLA